MIKTIRFFKQDNRWYADIPNHTLEENEMVMGSDMVLDLLASSNNEIFIKVSNEEPKQYQLHFHMKSHDDEGAYYTITGPLYNQYASLLIDLYPEYDHEIWICNVTHDVFGEHPENIYLIEYTL